MANLVLFGDKCQIFMKKQPNFSPKCRLCFVMSQVCLESFQEASSNLGTWQRAKFNIKFCKRGLKSIKTFYLIEEAKMQGWSHQHENLRFLGTVQNF